MNKDFEKEYKELAEIEAPDLWDRIEAGITEKEAVERTAPETTKTKTVLYFVKHYSALAAALLCAVIVIPVIGFMRYSGSKNMTSESAGDMDYAAAADTAAAAEEYEMATEEAAEESADDAGDESMAEACEEAPAEGTAMKDTALDDSASMANESILIEDQKKQKEEAAGGILQDTESSREAEEQKLTGIVIKITDAENHFREDSALDEIGTLYTAIVEKDPSGILEKGDQIEIFIPAYSSIALVKDEVFELDLEYGENGDDPYTVAGYHGRVEE